MSQDEFRPVYPSYPGYHGKHHGKYPGSHPGSHPGSYPGFYPGYYPGKYPHPYNPVNNLLPLFLLLPFLFRGERENEIGKDFTTHTIQEGEDLMDIAKKYNIPIQILLLANPDFQQPSAIKPGAIVHIPQLWDWSCHPMYMNEENAHFMQQPAPQQGGYMNPMYPMNPINPINPMMNPMTGFPQVPYPPTYPTQRDFDFSFDEDN